MDYLVIFSLEIALIRPFVEGPALSVTRVSRLFRSSQIGEKYITGIQILSDTVYTFFLYGYDSCI
jgi:hypothetical protein